MFLFLVSSFSPLKPFCHVSHSWTLCFPYLRVYFLCQRMCAQSLQSCPTLCDPRDCSPTVSSVHGILQARILEWDVLPFSRGSSQPRDRTCVSCIAGRFFTAWANNLKKLSWKGTQNSPGQSLLSILQVKGQQVCLTWLLGAPSKVPFYGFRIKQ